jgi:hypothetical protein
MDDVNKNLKVDACGEASARSMRLRVERILGSKEANERLKSRRQAL